MELWNTYDASFDLIDGVVLVRGDEIPDGLYHLVCEVLLKHDDGSYLLMQRYEDKHFGGMWEATAGGSAILGESPTECAARELKEETGITARSLTEMGRVVHHARHTIYVEYTAATDCEKDAVTLQEGETQSYKWISADDLAHMPRTELVTERMQMFVPEIRG